ncbi:MAG TPA: hypothetical protein VI300_27595 [Solirubrobacter sp.]
MLRNIARQGSIVAVLLLVTASVAFAAGGATKSSSSSISLQLMVAPTASGSLSPSYGQSVTFNVSTSATSQPFVHVKCSQNGTLVYESWQAWFYGRNGTQSFTMGGTPAWQGGAAECTAYLENWDSYSKNGKITVLASTAFHVDA